MSARLIKFKAPCISHAMVGLLLELYFHVEDPDGAGGAANIFLFPDL